MPILGQNQRFYLLLASLVVVVGIVIILGFSYFHLQQLFSSPSPKPESAETRRLSQLAWNEVDRLKAESATMPARPKQPRDDCLWVPLAQDIKTGIYKWAPVMLEPGQKQEGYYDFHYSGRLDNFEEKTIDACDYYELTLFKKGDFVLNIPRGIIPVGSFSRLDPSFLSGHKGKDLQLRVRFFSQKGENDLSTLKFIEWEIEAIKVN
jgi:hypothetical protein